MLNRSTQVQAGLGSKGKHVMGLHYQDTRKGDSILVKLQKKRCNGCTVALRKKGDN